VRGSRRRDARPAVLCRIRVAERAESSIFWSS
jgi:hypothetical protein